MRTIKRITIVIFILMTVVFLFRGFVYRHLVAYKSIGQRKTYLIKSNELTTYIETSIGEEKHADVFELTKLALQITSQQLKFSDNKNDVDPNQLIKSKTAHCVGYASFFVSTFNFLLKKYKLDGTWTAKQQVGQLYLLGTNVHQYVNTPFFKDHDFAIIENSNTGEVFAVDPTVNDYLLIDFVTYND